MPHISYSELKNWHHCPFYHKLVNIDKLKVFEGNEYTAFGTALHSVCEDLLTEEVNIPKPELFNQKFRDEIKKLKSEELNKKLIIDMFEQGGKLSEQVLPSLDKYFDDCEVFMAEEKLYEPISGFDDYLFKGFVDLIIKEGDDYHIIDWKTCSWGWDSRKRSDKMIVYQLILYKHFFCQNLVLVVLLYAEIKFANRIFNIIFNPHIGKHWNDCLAVCRFRAGAGQAQHPRDLG